VNALPKMADKSTDPELKRGFMEHLGQTKGHIARLEQVFKMHNAEAKAVTCPAIDGIIKEANETAGEVEDKEVLDAALRYGTLVAWAKRLGRNDCASILQQTLDEERATDQRLTKLAESKINAKAA